MNDNVCDRLTRNEILIPKEIQAFMTQNGIGRSELAEIFGVTIQAVNLWLTGKREFSVANSRLIRLFEKYPKLLKIF